MARLGTAPTRVFGVKETRLSGRGGVGPQCQSPGLLRGLRPWDSGPELHPLPAVPAEAGEAELGTHSWSANTRGVL